MTEKDPRNRHLFTFRLQFLYWISVHVEEPFVPRLLIPFVITALLGGIVPSTSRAGLYSPTERFPIPVRDDGKAEELSFGTQKEGAFPQLFATLLNEADANPLRKENSDRQRVMDQIAEWQRKPPSSLTPTEVAGLGVALARVGKSDEAVSLLGPRGRDRIPDFRILANLAHVHAARGEWQDAHNWHRDAFDLAEFPDDLPGTTPAQRTWLKKLERSHYRQWLLIHRERAATRTDPADDNVFPLFPVRFVNELGEYEPGRLAPQQRAKLPPDAIPVVQQLMLWAPWDTALYWLLAELYAADGRLREAQIIFDQCADGRQFANRRVFMAHRSAVRDAVAKLPPEKPDEVPLVPPLPPVDRPDPAEFLPPRSTMILAGIGFGGLAAGLMVLQVRAAWRRRRRARGRRGEGVTE
jgi:tetratricopeptide (TPR) repeat protein